MLDLSVKQAYKSKPAIKKEQIQYATEAIKLSLGPIPPYLTPTTIGIEVEIEKLFEIPHALFLWSLTEDGSLRDNGYEFVSVPLKDDQVLCAIEELTKIYKNNPKSTFSHRCSIHVHMDVTKLTVGQLRTLIATYICVEDLMFSLVSPSRQGNSYCYPLSDTACTWEDFQPGEISEKYKYCALNPHHLRDFGTLEFRHHGGTKQKVELINWIETILHFYRYVEQTPHEKVEETIMKLNTVSNYREFCKSVFKDHFTQFMHFDLFKAMRENVSNAKLFLS